MLKRKRWIRRHGEAVQRAAERLLKRSFGRSLVAVMAGNAIYFSLERFLPARAQHQPYQLDAGRSLSGRRRTRCDRAP